MPKVQRRMGISRTDLHYMQNAGGSLEQEGGEDLKEPGG